MVREVAPGAQHHPRAGWRAKPIARGCWARCTSVSQSKHRFLFSDANKPVVLQGTRGQRSSLPLPLPGFSRTTTIAPQQQKTLTSQPRGRTTDTSLPSPRHLCLTLLHPSCSTSLHFPLPRLRSLHPRISKTCAKRWDRTVIFASAPSHAAPRDTGGGHAMFASSFGPPVQQLSCALAAQPTSTA